MNVNRPEENKLEGRQAKCAYHGSALRSRGVRGGNECNYGQRDHKHCTCVQPSSEDLPFFEFMGAGSSKAEKICKHCKYHQDAHVENPAYHNNCRCRNFEAQGPQEFDKFFCGCMGWD